MAAVTNAFTPTGSTSNTNSYASSSFTPVAGDLLVVMVTTSGTTAATPTLTASANGITFTRLTTISSNNGTNAGRVYVFVANQLVGASPVAMTVTFDCTGSNATGAIISVARVSGMSKTGSSAVRQQKGVNNVAGGTAPSVVFDAACLTGNPTLFAFCVNVSTGTTQPTNWLEKVDVSYTLPTTGGGYDSRDSGFTGTTITLGSTANGVCNATAIELDTSAYALTATTDPASGADAVSSLLQGAEITATTDAASGADTGSLSATLWNADTSVVSDSFNRANGALGSNWTSSANPLTIASGAISTPATPTLARWTDDLPTDAMFAEATYRGGAGMGVMVAVPTFTGGDAFNGIGPCYVFNRSTAGGSVVLTRKETDASFTSLRTGGPDVTSGDRMRIEYDGVEIRCYVNGVLAFTPYRPVTPLVGNKGAGIIWRNNTVVTLLDDFAAGSLSLEAGAGVDNATVEQGGQAVSGDDTASGADNAVAGSKAVNDPASGADAIATIGLTAADTANGVDDARGTSKAIADTGSGADVASAPNPQVADTASGSDLAGVGVTGTDSGSGADDARGTGKTVADTAGAADVAGVGVTGTDTGSGADDARGTGKAVADSGSGVDSASAPAVTLTATTDAAAGTDTVSTLGVSGADTGTGTDDARGTGKTATDAAAGVDSASLATALSTATTPTSSDDFNRANGALGASWVSTTSPMTIATNKVQSAGGNSVARWAVDVGSPAMFSSMAWQGGPTGPAVAIPTFTGGAAVENIGFYYGVSYVTASTSVILVLRDNVGGETRLAEVVNPLVAGDVLRLEYNGSALVAKVNGAVVLTAAPDTPISGQYGVGILYRGGATNTVADDWSGGQLPEAAIGSSDASASQGAMVDAADTASATDDAQGTAKAIADSAAGADAIGDRGIAVADTGAGVDMATLSFATTVTDAGTGADDARGASKAIADTATGVDVASLSFSLTVADAGSGADDARGTSKAVADTGSGTDAVVALAPPTATDSAAGTDDARGTGKAAGDTATGVDAISTLVPTTATDTGAGTDDARGTGKQISDTATGADAATLAATTATATDSATGVDVASRINTGTASGAIGWAGAANGSKPAKGWAASDVSWAPNPDIETTVAPWTTDTTGFRDPAVAVVRSNEQAHGGSWSIKATWPVTATRGSAVTTGDWAINLGDHRAGDLFGFNVGETYTLSAWVYVPSGSPDVRAAFRLKAGGSYTSVKDQWVQVSVDWVANANWCGLAIETVEGAGIPGGTCYIDDVRLVSQSGAVLWSGAAIGGLTGVDSATGVDAIAARQIAVNQTASGADVASNPSITVTATDSGSGVDAIPSLSKTTGDTGAGADDARGTSKAVADSATAADLGTTDTPVSVADTGAAVDDARGTSKAIADAATGVDALTSLGVSAADSGTGTDDARGTSKVATDTATGTDLASLAQTAATDAATGTTTATLTSATMSATTQSGTATDAAASVGVAGADTGSGVDSGSVATAFIRIFRVTVEGTAYEAGVVKQGTASGAIGWAGTTAQGTNDTYTDQYPYPATLAGADTAHGTNNASLAYSPVVPDTASAITAIASLAISVFDTGHGVDALAGPTGAADTAVATDFASFQLRAADTGSATDTASAPNLIVRDTAVAVEGIGGRSLTTTDDAVVDDIAGEELATPGVDAATATDAATMTAAITGRDTARLLQNFGSVARTYQIAGADHADADDNASPTYRPTVADAASSVGATEVDTELEVEGLGIAVDAATAPAVMVAASDSAEAVTQAGVVRPLSAADTATSTNAVTARGIAVGDSAVAADATRPLNITVRDTAAGVDVANPGRFGSDTARGTSSVSLTARPTPNDSATGTTVIARLEIRVSDAATAVDSAVPSRSITVSGTATATDRVSIALGSSDSGHGSDGVAGRTMAARDTAVAGNLASTDTGAIVLAADAATATDTATPTYRPAVGDTAHATSSTSTSAAVAATDARTATDTAAAPRTQISALTNLVVAESNASLTALERAGDTAHGAEQSGLQVSRTASDTAQGRDVVGLARTVGDAATGSDHANTPAVSIRASDAVTGVDAATVTADRSVADAARFTSNGSVVAAGGGSDTAVSAEYASITVLIAATDEATATELSSLANELAAADLAAVLERPWIHSGLFIVGYHIGGGHLVPVRMLGVHDGHGGFEEVSVAAVSGVAE